MLENTLVVLTADHGELLGEHHLLNHQYSVHEPLLRVPLILYHSSSIPPGREARPVMTLDLFSTLLRLARAPKPNRSANSFDLLHPPQKRIRLSEYPAASQSHIGLVRFVDPEFDPTPFYRSLRAFRAGTLKYVEASDGTNALYDLAADPNEQNDLTSQKPDVAMTLAAGLERFLGSLGGREANAENETVEFDEQTRRRLEALGY
jgi:arylsulfatase A-like enzyme